MDDKSLKINAICLSAKVSVILYVSTYLVGFILYLSNIHSGSFFVKISNLIPMGIVLLFTLMTGQSLYPERRLDPHDILKLASVYLACFVLFLLLPVFSLVFPAEDVEIIRGENNLESFIYILSIIVFFPFFEEYIFRGIIYRHLRNSFGFILSLIISCSLFSYFHALGFDNFEHFFILGTFFCLSYELTGSYLGSFFVHSAYNLSWVIFVFLA